MNAGEDLEYDSAYGAACGIVKLIQAQDEVNELKELFENGRGAK